MLANLLRGATNYRNPQVLDSLQDDAHTRNLLFGQSSQPYSYFNSPPSSPFGSPTLRPSTYDDQSGLELDERDVRIVLAQDAHGGEDKPTLLFDSKRSQEPQSPGRHDSTADIAPPRNRSATISGASAQWGQPIRETVVREDAFLECMFGVTSATKVASSTKMHIIPASEKPVTPQNKSQIKPPDSPDSRKRTPLQRSRTTAQFSVLPIVENDRDSLLITRLFHVSLPENEQVSTEIKTKATATVEAYEHESADVSPSQPAKPPKLVERKVPAFAVGIVISLPQPVRQTTPSTQPASRYGQSFMSASSSFGSDMQSSWTLLDAIPCSMSSSQTFGEESDRRVDLIVNNWDIILRTLSFFQAVAVSHIERELSRILVQMDSPQMKTPKGKSMQRVNQRIVAIRDVTGLMQANSLSSAASSVVHRITYALRIPRVLTGVGFSAGHWTDEARALYKHCGGRTQNFFLFNLLTAFLGNHTQWMERLAPRDQRRQWKAIHKQPPEQKILASRTVIISQQKGLARRLIYILASFLLGNAAFDGIHRRSEDKTRGPVLSTSLPTTGNTARPVQEAEKQRAVEDRMMATSDPKDVTSTSHSSTESGVSTVNQVQARKKFARTNSSKFLVRSGSVVTLPDLGSAVSKTMSSAAPTTTATPLAHIAPVRDSYFALSSSNENVLVDVTDSAASADLVKVLHRDSSSHSVSSKWGSLMSNISDLWGSSPGTAADPSSLTSFGSSVSPGRMNKQSSSSAILIENTRNPLQDMVDELDQFKHLNYNQRNMQGFSASSEQSIRTTNATIPLLHVDDDDGVVDVELELPGFTSVSSSVRSKYKSSYMVGRALPSARNLASSTWSLWSLPTGSRLDSDEEQVNVAGYLRRHHEDFALHAVRPYPQLLADIKRSMYDEPTSPELTDTITKENLPFAWYTVCTTLIADMTTCSIRRLTLRRRFEVKLSASSNRPRSDSGGLRTSPLVLKAQEIQDEPVADFDTTLASAIEQVLNVSSADSARTKLDSKDLVTSSSKAVTSSSSVSEPIATKYMSRTGKLRQEYRNVIVGALEDIVNIINDDLHADKPTNTVATSEARKTNDGRQQNVLREGVKKWLLNVEHQHKVW